MSTAVEISASQERGCVGVGIPDPLVYSANKGDSSDRAIDLENDEMNDFLILVGISLLYCGSLEVRCFTSQLLCVRSCSVRVNLSSVSIVWEAKTMKSCLLCQENHVEGEDEVARKTKNYFTSAVETWDADYYIKVDDNVFVNVGKAILALNFSLFFAIFTVFPCFSLFFSVEKLLIFLHILYISSGNRQRT